MTKKVIILSLMIIGVVVLSGCTVSTSMSSWPPKDLSNCESFSEERTSKSRYTQVDCYIYMAIKLKNKTLCSKSPVESIEEECKTRVDFAIDPIAGCLKLTENNAINKCLFTLSNDNDDVMIGLEACKSYKVDCEANCPTANDREYCYTNLGVKHLDKSICEKVHSPPSKESCITRIDQRT